jgi:Fis family transcriptional regulator
MTARNHPKPRAAAAFIANNGYVRAADSPGTHDLPLRSHAERALNTYFSSLNGTRPARLYDMVMREIEEPLFRAALHYAQGNQSQAAGILGINRGTLRKKLREFGLADDN